MTAATQNNQFALNTLLSFVTYVNLSHTSYDDECLNYCYYEWLNTEFKIYILNSRDLRYGNVNDIDKVAMSF